MKAIRISNEIPKSFQISKVLGILLIFAKDVYKRQVYERLMYMAKYLQSPKHRLADLEDILWLSERSIRQDYSLLKGNGDSAVQILGKTFSIPDIESKKGQISMPSTVHPLFLTGNLTQIIVALKGLKSMSENPVYKDYAMTMATAIWDQLSEYAKDRIFFVTEQYLSLIHIYCYVNGSIDLVFL